MLELAKKVDKLERNFKGADYILSEVMCALTRSLGRLTEEEFAWAMRNYTKYLKEVEGG